MSVWLLSLLLLPSPGSPSPSDTETLADFLSSVGETSSRCDDQRRLMPSCERCVPGLSGDSCELPRETIQVRAATAALVRKRYPDSDRPLALYPYLETEEFLRRQRVVGERLERDRPRHVVDVGAYFNPIHLFLREHCPSSVVVIEPILEPLSALVPCGRGGATNGSTHVLHLPLTFKRYLLIRHSLPSDPDAVVCIGCDSHHGPSKLELLRSWSRPYTLYLEFSSDHPPNRPFHAVGGSPGATVLLDSTRRYNDSGAHSLRTMRFIRLDPA